MLFKHLRCLSLALGLSAAQALAASSDEALLAAFDAYRAGDPIRLARHAERLDNPLLQPWVDYWRLSLALQDAQPAEVRRFLKTHENLYVAELLRGEWLKVLGERGDWKEFRREAASYDRGDLEIRCYAWLARAASGERKALEEAFDSMWLEPQALPKSCMKIADRLAQEKRLSVDEVWRRARVLFEYGQITAAKEALGYLPKREAPDERLLAQAARQPKRVLERLPRNVSKRPVREVVVLAALRHARLDAEETAEHLDGRLAKHLPAADLRYLWGRVAFEGALQHHPKALAWYAKAGRARLDEQQLAWKARAALRLGDWQTLRDTIDRMPAHLRHAPNWTYWYGRALSAQGEETASRAYYLRVAGRPDFYGLLANEELGYIGTPPESGYTPTDEDVERIGATPGLARALELIRLGLRTEGVREWLFTIRRFDDTQLLAAAELARRAEVYDRAISTADRTRRIHNFHLRYPVPFKDVFVDYARTHQLDEAWVLGIVRQESRFISSARSSAGAAGLMQVMPRTARFVASRIGLKGFRPRDVTEVETNVGLGTGYLKMVLDQLGHPVLASTAYNAGPARARRWRDDRPLEAAVYIETIPFGETRDYVQKVMTNAVFYAAVLHGKLTPLKSRLGTVPARSEAEPPESEELP